MICAFCSSIKFWPRKHTKNWEIVQLFEKILTRDHACFLTTSNFKSSNNSVDIAKMIFNKQKSRILKDTNAFY